MKLIRQALQIAKENYQIAPIISGGVSLWFLREVIFSDLEETKLEWAIVALLILFVFSVLLYYFLSRLEKDKDVYLISSIGKIVEDVFTKYGVSMANSGFPVNVAAGEINKIMQTIVNLVTQMKALGEKKYRT